MMLLRLAVTNWRSISEQQELLLIASAQKDTAASLLRSDAVDGGVLSAIAIYGANASGKSNFLSAVRFMRRAIVNSAAAADDDDDDDDKSIPTQPFRLDEKFHTLPSDFQADFVLDGVRYAYGFSVDAKSVLNEHLHAYPKRRRQIWFERTGQSFKFGKELKGENATIQNVTRRDALFLSMGKTLNHDQLTPIAEYFRQSLVFFDSRAEYDRKALAEIITDETTKAPMIEFLKAADVGICDVSQQSSGEILDRAFFDDMRTLFAKHLKGAPTLELTDEDIRIMSQRLVFKHIGSRGSAEFNIEDESRGTQKLISLLVPAMHALRKGTVLFVDEMDTSLHPLLAQRFIDLFQSSISNCHGAQLVFTTHDTNLLHRDVLRRDQVWFAEKNDAGATEIYPLSDIKTKPTDNIGKGYLEGRYGAIPYLGNLAEIIQSREGGCAEA